MTLLAPRRQQPEKPRLTFIKHKINLSVDDLLNVETPTDAFSDFDDFQVRGRGAVART